MAKRGKLMSCLYCKAQFTSFHPRQKFCKGTNCKRLYEYERKRKQPYDKRVCPHCEVSFVPKRKNQVYCKYACRKAAQKMKTASALLTRVQCDFCGIYFAQKRSHQKYCCKECRRSAYGQTSKASV